MKKFTTLLFALVICNLLSAQISQISDFEYKNVFSTFNTNATAASGTNYYFALTNQNGKEELWKTNGSLGGTQPLLTFENIVSDYSIDKMTPFKESVVYFMEIDGEEQLFYYRPDLKGTITLSDFNNGEIFGTFAEPFVYNDLVFFPFFNSNTGEELWYSDGNDNSSFMLKDIAPGNRSSSFSNPFEFDGLMYFFAKEDSFDGAGLWSSDGTSANTKLIKLLDENGRTNIPEVTATDGIIIYIAMQNGFSDDLYISDGSPGGTRFVTEIGDGLRELVVVDGLAYFTINGGDDEGNIWVSNGTAAGTKVLSNFDDFASRTPFALTVFENEVFFFAYTDGDLQFSKINPSNSAITQLKTFSSSSTSITQGIYNVGDELLIVASEDFDDGYEIFKSDGTASGTKRLADLNQEYSESSKATDFGVFSTGDVVFKAEKVTGDRELFYYKKSSYQPFSHILTNPSIKCNGGVTTVTAKGIGGTPPYSYEWSSSLGVDDKLIDATAGQYSVTISDQNNESLEVDFEVTEPDSLKVDSFTVTPETGTNGDGSASVDVFGGKPPYKYLWSNGSTDKEAINLMAGAYSVTIEDANECVIIAMITVDMVSNTKEVNLDFSINPTIVHNTLYIKLHELIGKLKYNVLTTNGTIVKTGEVDNEAIDVSELLSGSYWIQLIGRSGEVGVKQFIKD